MRKIILRIEKTKERKKERRKGETETKLRERKEKKIETQRDIREKKKKKRDHHPELFAPTTPPSLFLFVVDSTATAIARP